MKAALQCGIRSGSFRPRRGRQVPQTAAPRVCTAAEKLGCAGFPGGVNRVSTSCGFDNAKMPLSRVEASCQAALTVDGKIRPFLLTPPSLLNCNTCFAVKLSKEAWDR